ncbi:hypothetical protein LguiA_008107 [Lonicera macranthoides]
MVETKEAAAAATETKGGSVSNTPTHNSTHPNAHHHQVLSLSIYICINMYVCVWISFLFFTQNLV